MKDNKDSKDNKEQKNDLPGNADSAKTRVSPEIPASSKKETEKPEKAKEREVKIVKRHSNSAPFSFILTAVYLLILIALSVFISLFALDVASEAFALQKTGEDVEVTLTGDYLIIETIADQFVIGLRCHGSKRVGLAASGKGAF